MRSRRCIAWLLLVLFTSDIIAPTAVYALTSGPTQPEVQSFQPVSASDMVDPFTGDFSYNIPLLDVEGYPVNLFYQAGITMDQEASWVGLGWNLNPGSINRNLRGLPDDFNGDQLTREMHMRPNRSFGISAGATFELSGDSAIVPLVGSASTAMTFNNYNGVSIESSLGASLSLPIKKSSKTAFTAGLGLSSGSHSGLRLQPQLGIDAWKNGDGSKVSMGVGLTLDSRRGLTEVSLDASATSKSDFCHRTNSKYDGSVTQKAGISSTFDIGLPTYSPQLDMSMDDLSLSFNFGVGPDVFTAFTSARMGAFFSVQHLRDHTTRTPAYGYLYAGQAQNGGNVALDFNREKGGPYTPDQASLGIAAMTPDIFTVTGQGVSGSYRAFRSEVGHVHDQYVSSGGGAGSLGLEFGTGNLAHAGADIKVNSTSSWSGRWNLFNTMLARTRFTSNATSPVQEKVFFRSASEPVVQPGDQLYAEYGWDQALRPRINRAGSYEASVSRTLEDSWGGNTRDIPAPSVPAREARGQLFNYLTHAQVANDLGFEEPHEHLGLTPPSSHMSEITILGAQGSRYIYGLPAYNAIQEDVTFSITEGDNTPEYEELVPHSAQDDSRENSSAIEQYYSKSTIPSYPHAFLLTAAVSADYSDVDDVRGPSDGDLGTYTKFNYEQTVYGDGPANAFYSWRTPVGGPGQPKSRLERRLGATAQDDKATYVYGEKELWYLNTIESQNRIAVFELNDPTLPEDPQDAQGGMRLDGLGVDRAGAPQSSKYQRYLTGISLYDKRSYRAYEAAVAEAILNGQDPDQVAKPGALKQVHFKYDYSLCPGTPNSSPEAGKLTLRRVWFTYGRSNVGVLAPYVFDYAPDVIQPEEAPMINPGYNLGDQDRWGQYKPDVSTPVGNTLSANSSQYYFNVANNMFPYTEQWDEMADLFANAWNLRSIRLPSGGWIKVDYGSDDYRTVQDRPAMRMFRIGHVARIDDPPTSIDPTSEVNDLAKKRAIYFRLPSEVVDQTSADVFVEQAVAGVGLLYFRIRMHYIWRSDPVPSGSDHVSGYAEMETENSSAVQVGGVWYGRVVLRPVYLDEVNNGLDEDKSPLFRSAIEHARLNYPKQLYTPVGMDDQLNGWDLIEWIPNQISAVAQFITGLANFFDGPNGELVGGVSPRLNGATFPLGMRMGESWIKLIEPDAKKKGGGHRVSTLRVVDSWSDMDPGNVNSSATYTQSFTYGDAEGSWGVAAYEPMIGADENPFRRPVYHNVDRTMSADERFYQEEPFGESLFPGPVVGYSRVEVRDISGSDLSPSQGTGSIVHEFYTARDFPTKTSKTTISPVHHPSPGISGLIGIQAADHMHVSQGFVIETNDMHGKPKATSVYGEPAGSGDDPPLISSVSYTYKTTPGGAIDNSSRVVHPDGSVTTTEIGRHFDFVMDMREYGSIATSAGAMLNLEVFMVGIVPVAFPPIIPQYSMESTRFRSAVLVKKIERNGLLRKVTKVDHGAVVSTENLAYDAQTGKVLLTRSNNEFGDPVYAFELPAYWHYDGMGPAYRNIGAFAQLQLNAQGMATFANAQEVFFPGDEVSMATVVNPPTLPTWRRGWVTQVGPDVVKVVDKDGSPYLPAATHRIKVVRSGRRNMQDAPMATIISQQDPLTTLTSNTFQRVLKASAVEFKDEWRKDCACSASVGEGNAYRDNRRGVWRQFRERTWLTDRTRSLVNDNTDIRHDGVYTSFDPLYKLNNGEWYIEPTGWTMVREVMDYSSRSQALEERDALGLYSSATFAHSGLLPNSVAANARHQEVGFESFESDPNCADQHFKFNDGEGDVVDSRSHSGRRSLRVPNGQQARFVAVLRGCPEEECELPLTTTAVSGGYDVLLTGGQGPFDFSGTNVLSGSPVLSLITNGLHVTFTAEPWSVNVVVRDAAGCERTVLLPPPAQP